MNFTVLFEMDGGGVARIQAKRLDALGEHTQFAD